MYHLHEAYHRLKNIGPTYSPQKEKVPNNYHHYYNYIYIILQYNWICGISGN